MQWWQHCTHFGQRVVPLLLLLLMIRIVVAIAVCLELQSLLWCQLDQRIRCLLCAANTAQRTARLSHLRQIAKVNRIWQADVRVAQIQSLFALQKATKNVITQS